MLTSITLALVGSAALVGCMPHQFSLSVSLNDDTDTLAYQQSPQTFAGVAPPAFIVPLSKYARSSDVAFDIEEGTIASLGPRFVNEFYKEVPSGEFEVELDLKCFGKCAIPVAKALPCLFAALAVKNPGLALKCVPSKEEICGCIKCMPNVVGGWVEKNVCPLKVDSEDIANAAGPNPVTFIGLASSSLEFAAFRGDLFEYRGTQIQELFGQSSAFSANSTTAPGFCVLGGKCGDKCCIGPCVDSVCVGLSY